MTDFTPIAVAAFLVLGILFLLVFRMTHVILPHQTGLVTIFGAYRGQLTPGFHLVHPLAVVLRVDLRTRVLQVPPVRLPVVGGAVKVGGQVSFRVEDAPRATFQTQDLNGSVQVAVAAAIADSLQGRDLRREGDEVFRLVPLARDALDRSLASFGVRMESIALRLES